MWRIPLFQRAVGEIDTTDKGKNFTSSAQSFKDGHTGLLTTDTNADQEKLTTVRVSYRPPQGPAVSQKGNEDQHDYCRRHNVSVCLYIAYIACGSASLYIKTLLFFLTVLALSAAAIVANIKIRYDVKIPQFAIFGTRVIYVFTVCAQIHFPMHMEVHEGLKLEGAGSPGLLFYSQISAGSPNMYCLIYTTPLWSLWRCNWAPWNLF